MSYFCINKDVVSLCSKNKISVEESFILLSLYDKSIKELVSDIYFIAKNNNQKVLSYQSLIRKNLVIGKHGDRPFDVLFNLDDYTITSEGLDLCESLLRGSSFKDVKIEKKDIADFDSFIKEYIECFPKGARNGGMRYLRADEGDIKSKMIKFMNKYKNYADHSLILTATREFLKRFKGDYTFCPTAAYFIDKGKSSPLAEECNSILNSSPKTPQSDQWM